MSVARQPGRRWLLCAVLPVLAVLCAGLNAGCGYSLAGRGAFLPASIKTIGVPDFTNRTTIFNLESQLTQKVRAEFIGRGKYQIVPEGSGVDALLTGEILAARIDTQAVGTQQLATGYSDHRHREGGAARRRAEYRHLAERQPVVSRRLSRAKRHKASPTRTPSSRRTRTRSNA